MRRSTQCFAVGLVLAAGGLLQCGSSGSGSSASANQGGNGGSANATNNGGSGTGTGGAGGANGTGHSFCVVGTRGCVCDGMQCASGLACMTNTCCDSVTGDCSAPPLISSTGSGGSGIGTGAGGTSAGGKGAGGSGYLLSGTCIPAGGIGGGATSAGGSSSSGACVPGVVGPVITDCGYPYASSNPRTSVVFNESEVLRAIMPSGGVPLASIRMFYNDEHALTLGVRRVEVTSSTGTTATDYPVSPLMTNPGSAFYPQTGTNEISGDQSGLDVSGRPMWPVLYVTDITDDPNNRSGDWQQCGTPYNPNAIFGTWKAAVRTVDTTVTPNTVSITPDPDPAKNNWNLGGGDPVPSSLTVNQGYGAEVRWDVVLVAGHSYRMQVMVHDGDQNKVGGDSGEACVDFCAGNACPEGSASCTLALPNEGATCSPGNVCVNGCCVTTVPTVG